MPLMRLYDISQLLESADRADDRVMRALEILRRMGPHEQCALLEARVGHEPRVVIVPPVPMDEHARLTSALVNLFGELIGSTARARPSSVSPDERHLAVPLIGIDDVVGLLFVRRSVKDYMADDLRVVSVVAAQLGAYLTMLRGRAEAADQRRRLDEARHAAEAANRTKDEFLALVSHELKTPLSSILAWAHILGRTVADEATRARAFEALEHSVKAQTKLIDDLLDVACVSTAAVRLNLRISEPASLIKATLEGLRLEAERKSIRLQADLDEEAMPLVLDADRIGQVVTNLVANAIKFTPAGGQVEVRLERDAAYARIHVKDAGPRIEPEVLPRIFDRFGTEERAGGLGVGLAIVKDLVQLHGGRVLAESAGPEQGATFTIELPRPRVPPDLSPSIGSEGNLLTGVHVLFVDRDPGIRDAFHSVLELYGAEVEAVASAAEVLEAMERARPDVLLFGDLAMPRANLYELMRETTVRSCPLPAAALTAYFRPEDEELALAAGFRMYLPKPMEIGSLISAVAKLAGRDTPLAR